MDNQITLSILVPLTFHRLEFMLCTPNQGTVMNPFFRHHSLVRIASLTAFLLISPQPYAAHTASGAADKTINKLYHTLSNNSKYDMAERIDIVSASFLGKPYVLGALGEGPKGHFDQSPLYRVNGFDCETYVDTVLALALGSNPQSFQQCINRIRYHQGEVSFLTRNHFASLDWNINNQKQGFIKDITQSFRNKNKQPVAKIAVALINKPSWYQHLDLNNIKLTSTSEQEKVQRLAELRSRGSQLPKSEAKIPYLPLSALFDSKGNPDVRLFAQIPDASIIEIVRPNWDLEKQIGTRLNVSHMGFAVWKGETLMFRQASSQENAVIEVPLIEYLDTLRSSPTIKGINVQIIEPQRALGKNCQVSSRFAKRH